ncbi:MAG TPA: hypothetical protein ENH62_16755 [Marinobacter sp.]|uniref:Uncharacterized protein n=1 Tax=marine sediment metagenome TaxID=412755 RepID=A0A0F9PVG0_9ZZZZ|nr:hypothetical protein [Marinobacter sp.]
MSNRVDYFAAEETALSVPAGRCVVYVDGMLCPYLEVIEIVRASGPGYGQARLLYNPALWADGERVAVERIETVAAIGREVSIVTLYNARLGITAVRSVKVFAGRIEEIETQISGDCESVELVARDFSARLGRIGVYGQRVLHGGGSTMRLDGYETVFNRDGLPNASKAPMQHEGKWYRMFEVDSAKAQYWTCAEAVVYLLGEHLVGGQLGDGDVEQLEGIFESRLLGEIDVNGMSLLDALEKCCEQTGVRFRFEPCQEEDGPAERIVFYRPGVGRRVELNHQQAGEGFSIGRTNICRIDSSRGFYPATHRYIGMGDWKVYEATFDLVKAWDSSLEGGPQSDYSPSTNPDFDAMRDVYRKWCLNEAGDYAGTPFDFGSIFERATYLQRRRTFLRALSTDLEGESLGYYLEVSYDDGATWQEYADSFDVLDDECGVWLADEVLSEDVWTAIGAGTLKFRITASVASDERLTVAVADGPVNSAAEVIDHVLDLSGRFEFAKVSGKSIFSNSASSDIGEPDEVDDSEALGGYIRNLCETHESIIETIDVETPVAGLYYNCGDGVTCSPDSRNVLGVRRDSRSLFWIERVAMDFQKQQTKLRILRRRGR